MENNQKQTNWVFLPVHKTRILKELNSAILVLIDFDRSTILPKVFKRAKETKDYIYFSLPEDFNANIRVSVQNEKTRRYEHKDYASNVNELKNGGLDKPFPEEPKVDSQEEEFVGENAEPANPKDDSLPF